MERTTTTEVWECVKPSDQEYCASCTLHLHILYYCNSGHNACNSTSPTGSCHVLTQCLSQGNEYLSLLVRQILQSRTFETRNAALFITWDEGSGSLGTSFPKKSSASDLRARGHESLNSFSLLLLLSVGGPIITLSLLRWSMPEDRNELGTRNTR